MDPKHVQPAFDRSRTGQTFLVTRPGSLTNTIIALKGLKVAEHREPEHKIFHAADVQEPKYTPMPDDIRAKMRGLTHKLSEATK